MNVQLHKAATRGHMRYAWLDTYHTFSFANYYSPERMHFGALRVLNDDLIAPASGFDLHPHDNMEIVTIPLSGDLEHRDSMGNVGLICEGDVQVMSAGTGIFHSEYNANATKPLSLLQIWVFPNKKNVEARYGQASIRDLEKTDTFFQIVSPNPGDDGLWVHQDAWFHLGNFQHEKTTEYRINKAGNGVYVFVIEGSAQVEGLKLEKRDGLGISGIDSLKLHCAAGSSILLMEVPV